MALAPAARLYGLDIETDTSVDGLDPTRSAVVAVAVASDEGDRVLMGDEPEILSGLEALLYSMAPGVIVTWNGASFDLPFLEYRARQHGLSLGLRLVADPSLPRQRASWGEHDHLDGYLLYRADVGRSFGLSCGLKALARLVGLTPVEVDRTRMHELDDVQMRDYVASDARLARELVRRRLPLALGFADRVDVGDRSPRHGIDTVTPLAQTA